MAKRKTRKVRAKTKAKAPRRYKPNPINPTRRASAKRGGRRPRRYGAFARRKYSSGRRKYGRRSYLKRLGNPAGILGQAFTLAGAGALIGLVQPMVGRYVLPYVGVSPITQAGLAFGTGWLLSMAAGLTSFTRKYKNDVLLAGGVVAAAQLISAYVVPMIRARLAPAPAPQNGDGMGRWVGNRWRTGMGGIAMMTNVPPAIAPPPPPPAGSQGMQGIGMRPGYPAM